MKVIKKIHIMAALLIFAPLSGIKALNSFESTSVKSPAESLQSGSQQQKQVSGVVRDAETQEPLIGVSIKVKGTNIATITDINGKYHLAWTNKSSTLVFSYIGKKTAEVSVNGRNTIDVALENVENTLSDVVVYTGYMTQKKADLTGSIAMANATDIKRGNSANAFKGLQGKMAGVMINPNGGNPA